MKRRGSNFYHGKMQKGIKHEYAVWKYRDASVVSKRRIGPAPPPVTKEFRKFNNSPMNILMKEKITKIKSFVRKIDRSNAN